MSTIKTNAIQTVAGKPILNSTGSILQVVQTVKTDTFSTTSTSYVDVTGMSASITPTSSSNKVLIICRFTHSRSTSSTGIHFKLTRGGSAIFVGNASGSRDTSATGSHYLDFYSQIGETITFLDSPSTTSSTTYTLQGRSNTGATMYINQSGYDGDRIEDARTASSIILMEISG
jgi:hypothetical protein